MFVIVISSTAKIMLKVSVGTELRTLNFLTKEDFNLHLQRESHPPVCK